MSRNPKFNIDREVQRRQPRPAQRRTGTRVGILRAELAR
jgi:hypothetical protein